jgi:hypothetical protein
VECNGPGRSPQDPEEPLGSVELIWARVRPSCSGLRRFTPRESGGGAMSCGLKVDSPRVRQSPEKEENGPVAHTCNPSYSGGREQEDHNLKPAWANSSQDPAVAQDVGPEFKP